MFSLRIAAIFVRGSIVCGREGNKTGWTGSTVGQEGLSTSKCSLLSMFRWQLVCVWINKMSSDNNKKRQNASFMMTLNHPV